VAGAPAIAVVFGWLFVNALVYYGVFLSVPSIGGNMYLNFFLASIVELPAIPGGIWIFNRFGRNKGVIVPMLLAAAGAAGSVLLTTDVESHKGFLAGKIILSMIWAKFWILIPYEGVVIYSAELFPTVVRNVGMSASSVCSGVGSFLSTYVIFLEQVHPLLPYGVMGMLALIAGLLCLLLPETRFKPTLENIEQENQEGSTETGATLPARDTGFVPQRKFIMFWCFIPYYKSFINFVSVYKHAKKPWPVSSHLDLTLCH